MFTVTMGALTIEVSCPLVEDAVAAIHRIETTVDAILDETAGAVVVFRIGPVTEQKE